MIGRLLVTGALMLTLGLQAAAAAEETTTRRAFEVADYYRTAFVGAPSVDAAQGRIAFAVTRYELAKGESWSEIWQLDPAGALRQMTFGRHHDVSPALSPDGRHLVFVSDRGGAETQLWIMPTDGGEARQLTSFPLGVSGPVWSPDGRRLAVTAEVYPECGADAECNRTTAESAAAGPLEAHMSDELLYRHWTSWRDGRFAHVLLVDAGSGEIVRDLTPGRWDSPAFSLGGDAGYVFSPDGRELCVVANHDSDPARSTNADLWLIDVEPGPGGATPRNLTAANRGWDGDPRYSPDGGAIAFRSQATPGFESDLYRLALWQRATGEVRYLTDRTSFDDWIIGLEWGERAESLIVQAERRGQTPLLRVPVGGGAPELLLEHASIDGWQLRPDRRSVVYARRAVGAPPELWAAELAPGEKPERLTRFNAALQAEVDIRPAQERWLPGANGRPIQVFLVTPHDFDPARKYPLILNVHGGPQSPWRDSYRGDWQVYPGAGYIVAFPNPTGSAGFGQDFVDAISCDWNGRVMRDIEAVTEALAALDFVDAGRMGAMGWSWGGYAMMWLEGQPNRFKALASMMGVYDLRSMFSATEELWFVEHDLCGAPWQDPRRYRAWSPSSRVERFATPCLVITGERDFRVPYTQSLQFFTDLQLQDVPSRLVVLPRAGHWPGWYEMAFYYTVHLDWFHRWLGGEPAPWEPERFLRNQVFDDATDE